ncbi:PilW family protein [Zestomonas carbonaria]|uniref:Uncharacterized protein n=1 Tax=Zestomonas carbonaria TaxID=2762745 RepID=A0A7U7EQE8_9GAMM|nr:hypothetical protein [Pseudomonas carbonaria]CAD5108230.1 hypothetical protein PSEWESI4_02515 [Pseudomonas carbonaria]
MSRHPRAGNGRPGTCAGIARQRGVNLISLMVGTLLSVIGILAMLTLYRNLVQTAVVATQDANQDGQLAAGLLTAQLELQNAGFGIDPGGAQNLLKTDVSLGGQSHPALLWRYRDATGYQCRGLVDRADQDAVTGKALRRLSLLEASGCGAGLGGLSWSVRHELARLQVPDDQQAAPQPLVDFTVAAVDCAPFGFGAKARHPQVTLTAQSSAQLAGASGIAPLSYSLCLSNIAE